MSSSLVDALLQRLSQEKQVRSLILGFHELRALVVATYDKGETLKEYGGTFSHGNTGNTFQDLARKVDELIVFGEPATRFVIAHEEDLIAREKSFADTFDRVQGQIDELKIIGAGIRDLSAKQSRFIDQVKMGLGTFGLIEEETHKEVARLCQADEELRALKLTMKEAKKTAKKSGAKRK